MSDRRVVRAVLLVLACAVAAPVPVFAQQRADSLAARRVALKARRDSLQAVATSMEMARRDSGAGPEERVGSLRVRTTALLRPVAIAAVEQALASARAALGADADALASRFHLTFREERSFQRQSLFGMGGYSPLRADDRITGVALDATFDNGQFPGFSSRYPMNRDDLASDVLSLLERGAGTQVTAPIAAWLGNRIPLRDTPPDFWPELYRSLATAGSAAVRRCVAGERATCRLAFALDSLPADRIAAWYNEADFPSLAGVAGDPGQRSWTFRSLSTDEQEDCTVRGQLGICARMLSQLPVEAIKIPMPDAARASLTRFALETGGRGAVERMRSSGASSVGAQLAAAAGVSVDSVVGMWQRRVIASRPGSPLPNATFVLASMACIVVCGGWAARGQPWK